MKLGVGGVYPRINDDERKNCFLAGLNGDAKAKELAITSLVPYAIAIAAKRDDGRELLDDAVQTAMLNVTRYFHKFDPTRVDARGSDPVHYFKKVVRNSINKFYERDRVFSELGEAVAPLLEDVLEQQETSALVSEVLLAMADLPQQQQDVIRARFGIGCEPQKFRVIAENYGCKKQNVEQMVGRGISRLRKTLSTRSYA